MEKTDSKLRTSIFIWLLALTGLMVASSAPLLPTSQAAQSPVASKVFQETSKTIGGKFLQYWLIHGRLAQQGLPISQEMSEISQTDGKTYSVQYFERAVFEYHPEQQPPNDVLLSLLGVFIYQQKYQSNAPNQTPNNEPGSVVFSETGKRVGGRFLAYWRSHGGLPQQGLPVSDEFTEMSHLNDLTQERLINWGYAICDAAMRGYVDQTLPAPDDFPYEDRGFSQFLKEACQIRAMSC